MLELDEYGQIISYEEYHPFGTTSYQATNPAINAVAKRYRYTGKERDEESGLYYHGARYYIPWLCRWTQCDPIGIKDGLNVYAYCSNNPVMLHDPSGNGGESSQKPKSKPKSEYKWSEGESKTPLKIGKPSDDYKLHTPVPESKPKPSKPSSSEFKSPIPIDDERFNIEFSVESKAVSSLLNINAEIGLSTKDGLTIGASKSGIGVSANSSGVTVSASNGTIGGSISSDGQYALTKDGNSLISIKESKEIISLNPQAKFQTQQSLFVKDATNIKPNIDLSIVPDNSNSQIIKVTENGLADLGVAGYKETIKETTVTEQVIMPAKKGDNTSFVIDNSGNLVSGTYGPKLEATYVETNQHYKLLFGTEISTTTRNGLNVPSLEKNRGTLNLNFKKDVKMGAINLGGQINTAWRKGK